MLQPKIRTKEYKTGDAADKAMATLVKKKYKLVYITRVTRYVLHYHK